MGESGVRGGSKGKGLGDHKTRPSSSSPPPPV